MTFIPDEIARVDPGTFDRVWGAWCGYQGYRCNVTVRQHSMQEPVLWMVFHFQAQPEILRPCPHGDETCPCQDGDVCHYVSLGDSTAMRCPRTGIIDCTRCRSVEVLGHLDETLHVSNFTIAANAQLRQYGWVIEAAELTAVGPDEMLDLAAAAQGAT